ncbi:MAG: hypothetical protein Q9172_006813 [Xanthocarpia lactea]
MPPSPFTNPFDLSSTPGLGKTNPSNYNARTGCFEEKPECSITQRRNAVAQIELAAQIAESTEIAAVKAHKRAKWTGKT